MAGVKAGHAHLCQVAGNTVWYHMAGDAPYLCHGFIHKELYVPLLLPFSMIIDWLLSYVLINVCEILELSRYNSSESGWDEQTAYCYKPVDIWEMDQVDWYVQNPGNSWRFCVDLPSQKSFC